MQRLLPLIVTLVLFQLSLKAQTTIVFHENFESPGLDDSMTTTQTVSGIKDWNLSTSIQYQGAYSDTCRVKAGFTTYLTSQVFSTTGNSTVYLQFAQIAKIDPLDLATLEVSADGGITWIQLQGAQYLGSGHYGDAGNRFYSLSYGNLWKPGTASAKPQNSWWKSEQFDVSALISNTAQAIFRFKLQDGGVPGPNNNYGWCLDDIRIVMSAYEMTPPTIITATNNPVGTLYSLGPFTIKAMIIDSSGIDTAFLIYAINSGINDTIGMIPLTGDTLYAVIPALPDSGSICYYISCFDNSPVHNQARNPVSGCISFIAWPGLALPYFNNFDFTETYWTSTGSGTVWQKGIPAYGATHSAHSSPNAWDVNLTTIYSNNANCLLYSPPFSFTGIYNASLSFWINYNTEASFDGTRLEYSTNGSTWTILGGVNDALGTIWYNSILSSTTKPAWNGNSNGWEKCTYNLSLFNNFTTVYFRFLFTSDQSTEVDGFTLDDFMLDYPAQHGAAVTAITSPVTGCSLGQEPITLHIRNTGLETITGGLTASYSTGNGNTVTELVPNIILPGDSADFTFTAPANFTVSANDSTFYLKTWVSLPGDPNHFDDTLAKVIFSKMTPPPPGVLNQTVNYATSSLLTATSPFDVYWYHDPAGGSSLSVSDTCNTPLLYTTSVFYAESMTPTGCISARVPDTVFVINIPDVDGALLSVNTPNSGIVLGSHETVTITIMNYGNQVLSDFTASFQINGLSAVTETISETIQPHTTLLHTFSTTADLSDYETYILTTWITVTGDYYQSNDTLTKQIINQDYTYCSSSPDYGEMNNIGNVTISNINNGNPFPATYNPSAIQFYSDFTQTVPPIELKKGYTYPVSVSPIYSSFSINSSCKIFIDWNHNGIFEVVTETAFTHGSTSTLPMTGTLTVPLYASPGVTRFRVVLEETNILPDIVPCGNYWLGETEDYTANICQLPEVDAGINKIISPGTHIYTTDSVSITCVVTNYGLQPITSLSAGYQINNGNILSEIFTFQAPLSSYQSDTLTFQIKVIFPHGNNSLKVFSQYPGDLVPSTDTVTKMIVADFPCQQVVATLDTSFIYPSLIFPNRLFICREDSIKLTASGIYPQNNFYYHQDDSSSLFYWDFGDGTRKTGKEVYHHFSAAGYYSIRLNIIDINGCASGVTYGPVVIISSNPFTDIHPASQLCPDIQNVITAGLEDTNTIHLYSTQTEDFIKSMLTYNSPSLISGRVDLVGNCQSMPILVDLFNSAQMITQASDIESVCVNIEHSFFNDLRINITCPSGQSIDLLCLHTCDDAIMGEPFGGNNHATFDCINPSCISDPNQNPPGTGWNYCWSNYPEFINMTVYAQLGTTLDSGSYEPDYPFTGLIGCPVNGEWTLKVCDCCVQDNGWLFNWKLNLKPALFPDLSATFFPPDTLVWNGPFITQSSVNQMAILPSQGGSYSYQLSVTDIAGCTYDTSFVVQVKEAFSVDCGPDLFYLAPSATVLSAFVSEADFPVTYLWSTGDTAEVITVNTNLTSTYSVIVTDADGCPESDSVTITIGSFPIIGGQLLYDNLVMTPITNTPVALNRNNIQITNTLTNNSGNYIFANICEPDNYTIGINCTKPHGGINASDALISMKYFVGMTSLSTLQEKAADVDTSGVVNAADALSIMKRFVGMSNSFPAGDWVFEDGNVIVLPTISVTKNIKGLCTGDIDRSHIPGLKITPAITLVRLEEVLTVPVDSTFELPVYADVSETFYALSLILKYLPAQVKIEGVIPNSMLLAGSSSFIFNLTGNELRIGWYSLDEIIIPKKEALFTLQLTLKMPVSPYFEILDNSAFANYQALVIPDAKLLDPGIVARSAENSFSVFPNPSSQNVVFSYSITEPGEVTLTMVNNLGQKTLLLPTVVQQAGGYSLPFSVSGMVAGVYYVQLEVQTEGRFTLKSLTLIIQ
ncbi:MAG: GEVED domain-containing protein [Bacteroidetes bacterium]|nr:GEVED domain-containing protein [Bacteroidota bacterium]